MRKKNVKNNEQESNKELKEDRIDRIDKLINTMEKRRFSELIDLLYSKKEIAVRNFIAGIFRGIGSGIGLTIITSIIIYFLQRIIRLNIPVIGEYVKDIVDIVEHKKY